MESLNKYKHYFIVLAALLFYLYVTEPLYEERIALNDKLVLSEKRVEKTALLLSQVDEISEKSGILETEKARLNDYIFDEALEGAFKVKVQTLVNEQFQNANCQVSTFVWRDKESLTSTLSSWLFEVQFTGTLLCIAQVTRLLESQEPLLRVKEFAHGGRLWTGKSTELLDGEMVLKVWQKEGGV